MHGAPKMPAGFAAMPYVNPDSPKGGRLTLGVSGTFDTVNPLVVRGLSLPNIRGYVIEGLMARGYDEPFTLYGLLAESVETDDNRTYVTFNLNPRARFSDGKPVTPEDVIFTWQLLRDKGRPNHRTYYSKVARAEITGPHSVRFDLTIVILLIFFALLILFPGYFLVITPFKSQENYAADKLGLPNPLYFENFATALRGGRFFLWFGNSMIMVVGAVLLSTVVAALAAFAFSRMRFRGQTPLLAIITALMVIPPVVMIIPLFIFFSRMDMSGSYASAVLVYAGLVTPFAVYMLTNFFRTIPHEIVESALIDGATSLGILSKILIPLSAPALVTLVVVNSLWVWSDLLIALVLLPTDEKRTLMVGITVFGSRYNSDVPVAMAGMIMASIPMLLLYIFGQKYFTRGLVAGALKG